MKRQPFFPFFFVSFVPLWFILFCSSSLAQLRGTPELYQALARLPVTAAVLHTGAHPDDEHSTLLAYLARGRHVRTAYLSATRGDGGQNLLGTEQYEALGLLRTQELLDARRLDGAEQFFTRAFDFGFSKTPEETLAKWGHDEILGDFVRVIRQYRPDIVISRFSGTSADGHGHHQSAGLLTPEAIHAAADPNRFPEQIREGLRPWKVAKFYQTVNRFGSSENDPLPAGVLSFDAGAYDPILGASYNQIGAEGRVLHRSQGFAGFSASLGPSRQGLMLRESALTTPEKDLFDGVDATLDRYTGLGAPADSVGALKKIVAAILDQYRAEQPEKVGPSLLQGLDAVRAMRAAANPELAFQLDLKEAEFKRALSLAYGWTVEAQCDRQELSVGENGKVTVTVWNRSQTSVNVAAIALTLPPGWTVDAAEYQPRSIGFNQNARRVFTVTPPENAPVSQPYWLELPRRDGRFQVANSQLIGRAETPPLMTANVTWTVSDHVISRSSPVVYRLLDPIYGHRDVGVNVVPTVAVWSEPAVLIFPPGTEREVKIHLRNNRVTPAAGKLSLKIPEGWTAEPLQQSFELAQRGEEASLTFKIQTATAAKPVTAAAAPFSAGYQIVNYPHIVPQYWFHPAETKLVPVDVKTTAHRRVGYIMGPGDEMPAALRQLGADLTMLEAADLLSGDLAKYDVIVAGIRTYAVRKDLVAATPRLLEYVKNGGVYVVQYQGNFLSAGQALSVGPYPMRFGRNMARVTVEDAPVEMLVPDHPLFNTPNKITAADFQDWVQERGLYFAGEWDPQYTPLLASNDPGEPSQKGGMLAARYGKGLYLYTAYAWFRQLPAGVPGAYRIWANILSWKP